MSIDAGLLERYQQAVDAAQRELDEAHLAYRTAEATLYERLEWLEAARERVRALAGGGS